MRKDSLFIAAAIAVAVVAASPANAQAPDSPTTTRAVTPAGPPADATHGFDAVRQGLAEAMTASAKALDAGQRHEATKAMDRALHLAEFATAAPALEGPSKRVFQDAHTAVKEGRHALQNGRPEDAARILADAGERLAGATLAPVSPAPPGAREPEDVEGLTMLNAQGHKLGELDGIESSPDGARLAVIGLGGFLGLGEKTVQVPLGHLLVSDAFVVLPETVSREEFAKLADR